MHAKLIYRSKGRPMASTNNNDTFRPCVPYNDKSMPSSAFQDTDMPPAHLDDINMPHETSSSSTRIIANPFRSSGAGGPNKLSGVLMERTNSGDVPRINPLARTSSGGGLKRQENLQSQNSVTKEEKKPSTAARLTVIKPLTASKEFKLPIRPLTLGSKESTPRAMMNQASFSFPIAPLKVVKTVTQSNKATRNPSKAGILPRSRLMNASEAQQQQVRQSPSDPAPTARMAAAPAASRSMVRSRLSNPGERPVIDMRSRVMAREAALRVLVNLKKQGKLPMSPKDRANNSPLAFKARPLKSTRKVDVAKVWESAVKFFQAEHAHRLVTSLSAMLN